MTSNKPVTSSHSKGVRIVESNEQAPLSNAQKSFNKLIKKIDKQRELLVSWQSAISQYQQQYDKAFAPLLQTFKELRERMVELLDRSYAEKGLSKAEREQIKETICVFVAELLADDANEKLKSIYNRYSDTDFDTEAAEANGVLKAMMEDMLGVELDDEIDFTSPEQVFEHVGEKVRQQKLLEDEAQQEHAQRHSKRKKSAKELAKESRQQAEEQNVSQAIREVFRKLASALHPDREQDPLERDRKTALMQSVNVAYKNKDLLRLLELQLEVEQIDQSMINSISEDRLKHYNKVLSEQAKELQQEIDEVEYSFRMQFNFSPDEAVSPKNALLYLRGDVNDIGHDIAALKRELVLLQNIKNLKSWLKSNRIQRSRFDNGLDDAFDLPDFFK